MADIVVITCQINHQHYALPIHDVCEIVARPALLELAGAPPALAGILNRRGRHLTVLDGRVLVGAEARIDPAAHIMLLGAAEAELGLLVDAVLSVENHPAAGFVALDHTLVEPWQHSVIQAPAGPLVLVDRLALATIAPILNQDREPL